MTTLLLDESNVDEIYLESADSNTVGDPKLILVPDTVPTTAVP